ncbi:MAG TPA: enoyl-CoA hydratase-related protein [Candidatus Limnocylindrales bacterium]|nr:enoyl-CoA hydratase-related protein [Candidatus Limnocylindrales bacterium]
MSYEDILVEHAEGTAWITINREDKGNAFRVRTLHEMIDALEVARRDADVRTVVLTGAGARFFSIGGDHDHSGEPHDDRIHYGNIFPVVDLYDLIDKTPKPVIAMVNGFAVGGGNVLALMCDLTIASSTATFRQVGPMMGSFDAGFGTWYLEEAVGRKKAKEIWMLNRKYPAADALAMGLINEVVAPDKLREHVISVCDELADRGPQALAAVKSSFHARHSGVAGLSRVSLDLLTPNYYRSEESKELGRAFGAREKPDRGKFYR